jgi:hypothetical protein
MEPGRSSRLPFDAVTVVPPEKTIFYAATSNDPVLSRISPTAMKTYPNAMSG